MSRNDLVKVNASVILSGKGQLDEYIKPLSRDILLFETKIGATYRLKNKEPLHHLSVGERLFFKRSDSNYDEDEIRIYNKAGDLVGFVPEADSPIFARLMDAGKMLFATIKSISFSNSIPLIEIDIYLQDF